jgi:hypothetical protein
MLKSPIGFLPAARRHGFHDRRITGVCSGEKWMPKLTAVSGTSSAYQKGWLHDAGLRAGSSGLNGENWFDRAVSADAAGIILTSLAVNRRLASWHDCGNPALTHLLHAA